MSTRILLLTVGTGSPENIEGTILSPFLKSMLAGRYERIILLPSHVSADNARLLSQRHPGLPIEIHALGKAEDENNLDACYRRFDEIFERLINVDGVAPAEITADFTRGTKVMSAALSMAAVAHGVREHRYLLRPEVDSETRAVIAGTEMIQEFAPDSAFTRVRYEHAREFLNAGHFQAARRLLESLPAGGQFRDAQWLLWAARLWGAWDYFHYREAWHLAQRDNLPAQVPAQAQQYLPGAEQMELLRNLAAKELVKREPDERASGARAIGADLLANAGRRFREGQFEEVLVRCYRVLEILGQIRLFTYGIDSADVDPSHPVVARWLEESGCRPGRNGRGGLMLARENAARLLWALGDNDMGPRLAVVDWLGAYSPNKRNHSILIHGYRSKTHQQDAQVAELLQQMAALFKEEHAGNEALCEAARFRFMAR